MAANIIYGSGIAGETELRLCGDVSGAKRTLELGVSEWYNSIEFAKAGAKAIAVDPDPDRIAEMRRRADEGGPAAATYRPHRIGEFVMDGKYAPTWGF